MNRAIIVEEGLLEGLHENLAALVLQWKIEGAEEVVLYTHSKGANLNPNRIRTLLKAIPNLEGAFLIGDLPVARIGDSGSWYASDYFFMELDGNWSVDENNFVTSDDNLPPSIFIGRLVIGDITGTILIPDKPTILEFYNQYLKKLIAFRNNAIRFSLMYNGRYRGVYRDEARNEFKAVLVNNWGGDTDLIIDWLTHLYPRENISAYEDVDRDEYWSILEGESYDFIAFRCHSAPMLHLLEDNTEWQASEYLMVESNVNFFELTACDTGSFVWESPIDPSDPTSPKELKLISDLLAWNIQFAEKGGLLVLAPSISGGMNNTSVFYDYLHDGGTFGCAFKLWAEYMHSFGTPDGWAYIILFGDPFIHFNIPTYSCVIYIVFVGSIFEHKIKVLRMWRDKVITKKPFGKQLVRLYYRISPIFSKIVIKFNRIKALIRWFILQSLKYLEKTQWNQIVKYHMRIKAKKKIIKIPRLKPLECKSCKKN